MFSLGLFALGAVLMIAGILLAMWTGWLLKEESTKKTEEKDQKQARMLLTASVLVCLFSVGFFFHCAVRVSAGYPVDVPRYIRLFNCYEVIAVHKAPDGQCLGLVREMDEHFRLLRFNEEPTLGLHVALDGPDGKRRLVPLTETVECPINTEATPPPPVKDTNPPSLVE